MSKAKLIGYGFEENRPIHRTLYRSAGKHAHAQYAVLCEGARFALGVLATSIFSFFFFRPRGIRESPTVTLVKCPRTSRGV